MVPFTRVLDMPEKSPTNRNMKIKTNNYKFENKHTWFSSSPNCWLWTGEKSLHSCWGDRFDLPSEPFKLKIGKSKKHYSYTHRNKGTTVHFMLACQRLFGVNFLLSLVISSWNFQNFIFISNLSLIRRKTKIFPIDPHYKNHPLL